MSSNLTHYLARHLRDVHLEGNWTSSNLRDVLSDVTVEEATTQVASLNTIAHLLFHINYYVDAVANVLQGGPLDAHDRYSYDLPPIESEEGWQELKEKAWRDAERFADRIEELPEEQLWEDFVDPKYGNYYSNIQGIIDHTNYHLGQIVLIRKMIKEGSGTGRKEAATAGIH